MTAEPAAYYGKDRAFADASFGQGGGAMMGPAFINGAQGYAGQPGQNFPAFGPGPNGGWAGPPHHGGPMGPPHHGGAMGPPHAGSFGMPGDGGAFRPIYPPNMRPPMPPHQPLPPPTRSPPGQPAPAQLPAAQGLSGLLSGPLPPPAQQAPGLLHDGELEPTTVWMGDLQPWMTDKYLQHIFFLQGEKVSAKVIMDKKGRPAGYGFIKFSSHQAALRSMGLLNGKLIPGTDRLFRLNWASRKTLPLGAADGQTADASVGPGQRRRGGPRVTRARSMPCRRGRTAARSTSRRRRQALWGSTRRTAPWSSRSSWATWRPKSTRISSCPSSPSATCPSAAAGWLSIR